jgi:hypothetical protein
MADFVKQIHTLLSRTHNECLDQLKHLRFDPDVNNHLMIVSLYCSLVEYAGTILVLTEQGRRTGFSSVFRSFIEGYVDLQNLLRSEAFYYRKEASFHDEWRKVLQQVGTDNPYLKGIAESDKLDERLKWHIDTLKELADQGHAPIAVSVLVCQMGSSTFITWPVSTSPTDRSPMTG